MFDSFKKNVPFLQEGIEVQKANISKKDIKDRVGIYLENLRVKGVIDAIKRDEILERWDLERAYSFQDIILNRKKIDLYKENVNLLSIYFDGRTTGLCIQNNKNCINIDKDRKRAYLIGRKGNTLSYIILEKDGSGKLKPLSGTKSNEYISRVEVLIFEQNNCLCIVRLGDPKYIIRETELPDNTDTVH